MNYTKVYTKGYGKKVKRKGRSVKGRQRKG